MKSPLPVRLALALAISLIVALLLVLMLYITDLGLSVWERLQQAHPLFLLVYFGLLVLLAGLGSYFVWRLLAPRRSAPARPPEALAPPDEGQLLERLERSEAAGIPVETVRREIEELQRRRSAGLVVVALFGEVSTGKTSLIRALLPQAVADAGPQGGTTRRVIHYTWTSPAGDRLVLADLPGLNEADGSLDEQARAEALRAHVVVYVCDGDLTRDQYQALRTLQALDKPLILALNKIDRFRDDELASVRERLAQRVGDEIEVIAIRSGGREELTRVYPDGRQEVLVRERPPQIDALRSALQQRFDADPQALEQLRDTSVFVLAQHKLDTARAEHRRTQASALIQSYSRKAAFGAMAAVGPGTDVLIQGYLGINMLKELSALYEVEVRDIDMQRFLSLAGGHAKRNLNLLLALVGNIFKAFPGMGTVVGGMLHAVAYGLIFESLGKAVARSLETRGDLSTGPALRMFEDDLGENLEARARRLARLVVARPGKADD